MKKQLWQLGARVVKLCAKPVTWIAGIAAALSPVAQSEAPAQVVSSVEGSDTVVTHNDQQYDIAGGKQAGGNLFHEFDEFDLGEDQVANFVSDSGVFNIVGQVTGGNASYVDGTVQVSGSDANLYLVNPSGVLFGPNARLSLSGSFTATTADQIGFGTDVLNVLEDGHDYKGLTADPSALMFTAESASAVVNQGELAVDVGESLFLIGGSVVNTGRIEASGGEVGLIAVGGDRAVKLSTPGSLLSMEIDPASVDVLSGDGASLVVTDLPQMLTGSPVQGAQSLIVNSDGSVTLSGSDSSVTVERGSAAVSGEVSVASEEAAGGTVAILGDAVALVDATVDASGDRGGTVRVGGDISGGGTLLTAEETTVDVGTTIRADGTVEQGGSVVVWSDDTATVSGTLSARGETLGGFIETSAHTLNINGIDADAGGQSAAGTWLVDPGEIEIVSGAAGVNQISTSTIESALDNNNDFEVRTDDSGTGDITLSASINATNAASTANLTFASRRFEDNGHKINLAGTGLLQFLINAVNTEENQDGSSIQNAIDSIGAVNGRRRLFIESGNYDFVSPVVVDKDVEIAGDQADDTVIRATSNTRLFNIAAGQTVSFDYLTFTTEGLPEEAFGGGIKNLGNLTVENSTFADNRGEVNGGAIDSFNDATLRISDTDFINNSAVSSGGAISSGRSANVTIENATFDGNEAGDDGGALRFADVTASVQSSRFINNVSGDDGGAVVINGSGSSEFDSVTFDANTALNSGGAFDGFNGATVTFDNTTFSNNRAARLGGGLLLQNGNYEIKNSTILANGGIDEDSNELLGGGIFSNNSSLLLDNTAVLLNTAERHGGGLFQLNGSVNITNDSTIEGNEAAQRGGGIFSVSGLLSAANTHFAHNSAKDGGAVFIRSDNQTIISDSVLFGNLARGDGGAIATDDDATLNIERTTLLRNESEDQGGALYHDSDSAVTVVASVFDANEAQSDGGAIASRATDGTLTLRDSIVQNNITQEDGGAIFADSGTTVTVQSTQLINNRAETTTSSGGGLYLSTGANASIDESVIDGNFAGKRGGGSFVDDDSALTVTRTTVSNNRSIRGAGVFNQGTLDLVNTTVSENQASDSGGAVFSDTDSELSVRNSTVANNSASEGGGIDAASARRALLQNTIVAANSAAIAADVRGTFEDEGNNLIGQADSASGFTRSTLVGTAANPLNPRLLPLADNGGPTKTHSLSINSAAVNAGATTNIPTIDQRGRVRFSGSAVDIGAVELTPDELTPEILLDVNAIARLDPTLGNNLESADSVILSENRQSLSSDDVSIRNLERAFSQDFEDYWDLSAGPDLTFSEVQAILRRAQEERTVNSAVVYAVFAPEEPEDAEQMNILRVDSTPSGDDLLNLSVVMPEGELVSYQLPVTRRDASRQVRLLRSTVSDPGDVFGHQSLTQQLYQWLLAPIEKDLAAQNIQNLMYALDAGLRTAPIAAMRDYAGYSLERYGISVVPSMGLMQAEFPAPVRRATVAMGVAEFIDQPPLPAVPIELEVLDKVVPASQTVLNEKTTLDALTSVQALEQPGVLHLATHASFDNLSPESSLIHLWNEDLSMKDFSQLGWGESDLEMLILSACSTALSGRNSELGFAGLAAAAGVDATVGSLWEVSDVGTLALMSEFYAQLEKTPLRGEALRNAQLALLSGDTRIEGGRLITSYGEVELPEDWGLSESVALDHPFFWSAFTMVGNPW